MVSKSRVVRGVDEDCKVNNTMVKLDAVGVDVRVGDDQKRVGEKSESRNRNCLSAVTFGLETYDLPQARSIRVSCTKIEKCSELPSNL
jgi:hypothetical protein